MLLTCAYNSQIQIKGHQNLFLYFFIFYYTRITSKWTVLFGMLCTIESCCGFLTESCFIATICKSTTVYMYVYVFSSSVMVFAVCAQCGYTATECDPVLSFTFVYALYPWSFLKLVNVNLISLQFLVYI